MISFIVNRVKWLLKIKSKKVAKLIVVKLTSLFHSHLDIFKSIS